MKNLLKIYEANSTPFEDSGFENSNGDYWSAPYLYKKVKERQLKPSKVHLKHLDLSCLPWSDGSIRSIDDFLYHSIRVQNTDTLIPVIIGWDGYIMDGWHRLVKAVLEGKKTIKAYRFESYVEPEKKGEK